MNRGKTPNPNQLHSRPSKLPPSGDRSSLGLLSMDQMSHLAFDEMPSQTLPYIRTQLPANNNHSPVIMAEMAADVVDNNWHSVSNSLNLSDLVDDNTVDMRSKPSTPKYSEHLFEPSEITGRSTEHTSRPDHHRVARLNPHGTPLNLDLSTEQILSQSSSEEVRRLAVDLNQMKVRQSYGGRTADISLNSNYSSPYDFWGRGSLQDLSHTNLKRNQTESSFKTTENLSAFMAAEEHAWTDKYGILPTTSSLQVPSTGNLANGRNMDSSEFSPEGTRNRSPNMSMGRFFQQRSALDMLIGSTPLAKSSNTEVRHSITPDKTFGQSHSIFSESKLHSILHNEYGIPIPDRTCQKIPEMHQPQVAASDATEPSSSDSNIHKPASVRSTSPLADVLFVSKPIPLAESNPLSSNVNIINYEEISGNTDAILKALQPNLKQSYTVGPTELTPSRQHIVSRKNVLSKSSEEHHSNEDKENVCKARSIDRFLSDTVSYTESMLENSSTNHQNIIVTSPTLQPSEATTVAEGNRKRSRASAGSKYNESSFHTPTRKVNIPVVENVHVLQSKSRLFPNQRTDSDELELMSHQTNAVNDLDTVESRSPSPTPSKNSPMSSTFSSPHFSSSKTETRPMEHSNHYATHMAAPRSISPRMLTRTATMSQFGSSSDLYTSRNEISGIKASCKELSWGSTRLRMLSKKHFTIKNMSDRRLLLRMEIIGPGFQTVHNDDPTSINIHSQECRTITIAFCPTVIGPAVGRVVFTSNAEEGANRRCIFLYGFGGHASMQVMGTIRDPFGSPFLCLGDLRDVIQASSAKQWFTIYNQGPLPGMVSISVKLFSKDGSSMDPSTVHVQPSKCILAPESQKQICVHFKPRRNDLRKLSRKKSPVSTLATLEIIYGDEPNRQRVARLLDQLRQQTNQYDRVDMLVGDFPSNDLPMINFDGFNEHESNISDLFGGFKSEEVVLTVDHVYINETVLTEADVTNDDTLMFNSLISVDSSSGMKFEDTTTIPSNIGCSDSRNIRQPIQRQWSVSPTRIHMNPNNEHDATQFITIINNMPDDQMFEVVAESNERLFDIRPSSGSIRPGEKVPVQVRMNNNRAIPAEVFYLSVYFKNDKIDVLVEVIRNNASRFGH